MAHTFDPSNIGGGITLSNGNLTATCTGTPGSYGWDTVLCTPYLGSGKWYIELTVTTAASASEIFGFANSSTTVLSGFLGEDNHSAGADNSGSLFYSSSSNLNLTSTWGSGAVVGLAIDTVNSLAWWNINGGSWNSAFSGTQNPATGAGGWSFGSYVATPVTAAISNSSVGNSVTINFGATSFAHTPPSGFTGPDTGTTTPQASVGQSLIEYLGASSSPSGLVSQAFGEGVAANASPSGLVSQAFGEGVAANASPTGTISQVFVELIAQSTSAKGGVYTVGGWAASILGSGFTVMAADPFVTNQILGIKSGVASTLINSTSGSANLWVAGTGLITGVTSGAVQATWTPNGNQILVSDPTAGVVQVLAYSAGTLSIAQTLSVAGALATAIAADNAHALVATGTQLQPLVKTGGTWAVTGSPLSLPGATTCLSYGSGGTAVAAAGSGAVSLFNLISGVWATGGSIAIPVPAKKLVTDLTGNFYAVGASAFTVVNSTVSALLGSGSWSGSFGDCLAYQSQLLVSNPASGLIEIFGPSAANYAWPAYSTTAYTTGQTGLMMAGPTIFSFGASGTSLFNFAQPFHIRQNRTGAISTYSNTTSSWSTLVFGPDIVPTAFAAPSSAVLYIGMSSNAMYTVNPRTATLTATGIVPQNPSQAQSTPLGVSSLLASGSSLLAGTVLAGDLIGVI